MIKQNDLPDNLPDEVLNYIAYLNQKIADKENKNAELSNTNTKLSKKYH